MEFPEQLKNGAYRFVKISMERKGDALDLKRPVEKDWNGKNNYTWVESEFRNWIKEDNNYGVLCGNGLIVIDCDMDELRARVEATLPETFTVKSGRGTHFYFICDDLRSEEGSVINLEKDTMHYGEIRYKKCMVIGPGSMHRLGTRYTVIKNTPILPIKFETLKLALGELIPEVKKLDKSEIGKLHHNINLKLTDIIDISGFRRCGNEYQGNHPLHGSTGGGNFNINEEDNIWHCWRHDSGGSVLHWIAVKEGILKCEESKKGCLKGDIFKKVLDVAKEKYGLVIKETIKNVDWSNLKTIDLALDFDDKYSYALFTIDLKDGATKIPNVPILLRSDKQYIILDSMDKLSEWGIVARKPPMVMSSGWEREDMHKWLTTDYEYDKDLYNSVKKILEYFIDIPDQRVYDVLVCWIIGTYFFPIFDAYPYLFVNATKGSGKTKLLNLLEKLCFNARAITGPSIPSMFRFTDSGKCTLLLDEGEHYSDTDMRDIRALLLSGYKKGSKISRAVEEVVQIGEKSIKRFNVEEFQNYSPKAIANISGLDDVLESRCITIPLLKTHNQHFGARTFDQRIQEIQNVTNHLYANFVTGSSQVRHQKDVISDLLDITLYTKKCDECDEHSPVFDQKEGVLPDTFFQTHEWNSIYKDYIDDTYIKKEGVIERIGDEQCDEHVTKKTPFIRHISDEKVEKEGGETPLQPSQTGNYSSHSSHLHFLWNIDTDESNDVSVKMEEYKRKLTVIKSRDFELWMPLLTVALCYGKFDDILDYALYSTVNKGENEFADNYDLMLLEFLLGYVDKDGLYLSKDIYESFLRNLGYEQNDKGYYIGERPPAWLNRKWLGKAFKRMGISMNSAGHSRSGNKYTIDKKKIEDLAQRQKIKVDDVEKQKILGEFK